MNRRLCFSLFNREDRPVGCAHPFAHNEVPKTEVLHFFPNYYFKD